MHRIIGITVVALTAVFFVSCAATGSDKPTTATAPVAAASSPSSNENDEQELIKLEKSWNEADVTRDKGLYERILADDYFELNGEGKVVTKAETIKQDQAGERKYESINLDYAKVRVYGNTAVVIGHNTGKGKNNKGAFTRQWEFTDVFLKRDGRWQCVATRSYTSKMEQ